MGLLEELMDEVKAQGKLTLKDTTSLKIKFKSIIKQRKWYVIKAIYKLF